MAEEYEMVIGLEVHAELKTKSKIFCGCSTAFGAAPNTQCCPVCMGMPGTLPVLNEQVVACAVKAGLATNCQIALFSKQDRKNYFYPDLPKAYQISQKDFPLCEHGYLDVEDKRIGITRIHIEEDAGKLIHKEDGSTLIDYNRCGVPLIEIVSEPDLRGVQEVKDYLHKLRAILLYAQVSDCKMNEGSLRCDVNLSVRKKGTLVFGTRTEIKNLNSFQFVGKAIAYEFARQCALLDAGEAVIQETRRYEQSDGKTYSMRKKEEAHDYRFFPEPDLAPIVLTPPDLERLRAELPLLPDARRQHYLAQYGLSAHDAQSLVMRKEIADYFEQAVCLVQSPKLLANLLLSQVLALLPPDEDCIPISPAHLAKIADLLADETINSGTAKRLIQQLWEHDQEPLAVVKAQGWEQINEDCVLVQAIEMVLRQNGKVVHDYQNGKKQAFQTLIGKAMAATKGRGNPVKISDLLRERV